MKACLQLVKREGRDREVIIIFTEIESKCKMDRKF